MFLLQVAITPKTEDFQGGGGEGMQPLLVNSGCKRGFGVTTSPQDLFCQLRARLGVWGSFPGGQLPEEGC